MPCRNTHIGAGLVTGTLSTLAAQGKNRDFNLHELLGAAAGGVLGGRLADLIDPPTSPNHRDLGHSPLTALVFSTIAAASETKLRRMLSELLAEADYYLVRSYDIPSELQGRIALCRMLIGFANGISFGNLSHLALDSATPAGIKL